MPGKSTLIFDLDGTLVECGKYYDDANRRGAEYMHQVTGLPVAKIRAVMSAVDLAAVTLADGFSRERFPRSFEAVAMALCHTVAHQRQVMPYWNHVVRMGQIANSVFDAPYDELDGVRGVLEQYRAAGWHMVLYTKGDKEVQSSKIQRHGYNTLFDYCIVTPTKSVEMLSQLTTNLGIDPAESWVIGDSPKDDIAPAAELGYRTVFVKRSGQEWSYDNATVEATATIEEIARLPDVLPSVGIPGAEVLAAAAAS